MKHIPLKSTIAFVTFIIGVGITAFWFTNTIDYVSDDYVSDVGFETQICHQRYSESFDGSDYKNVVTSKSYRLDAKQKRDFVSEQKANAEATANLFARFQEMPLSKSPQCVDECYRLTWLPTFHAPTVIRVWRSGDEYFIATKRLDGKGGYELGELETEQIHALTIDEWKSFDAPLLQNQFWKTSALIKEGTLHDGASWTLEGFSNGKYHSIYRRTPSKQLTQIFKRMFDLSGVETEHEDYLG
ncbi:MAG: hypothetical protein H7Z37_13740 [Pyrinomonadaceae bacterium]|nr:hypothetical protein [Pyrinomonadaceae bacterium]